MRKVLVIAYDFTPGGGIGEVSRQIVSVINNSTYGPALSIAFQSKVQYPFVLLRLVLALIQKAIVIFTHPFIYERFEFVLSLFPKSKCIVWTHGIDVWGEFGKCHASRLSKASIVVAVSNYTKKQVLSNFPNANVIVIPNSCCIDGVSTLTSRDHAKFQIVTVARLASDEQYKGHELVINAINLLRKKGVSVVYNVVGKGNDLNRLRKLSHDLSLSKQVLFHGFVSNDDIADIYAKSTVFVMPSRVVKRDVKIWGGEGFGIVYLEAGMYGLPVIACNEGGQTDCVVDNLTGFLVNPDVEEIADKIQYLYENPDVAKRMGHAGQIHVKENFSFEIFRNNVLKVIDNLIMDKI